MPADTAAAISPKLEMAAAVFSPPTSQARHPSHRTASPAVAADSTRNRRWALDRTFISGADRPMGWLLEGTQVPQIPVDQEECDSSVSPKEAQDEDAADRSSDPA